MQEQKFQKELITPEIARQYLDKGNKNRHLHKSLVTYLSDQIRKELWIVDSGQPIKFDWNDKFIDGNHRLSAIIETGIAIETWVAYGVDPNAFPILDTGLSRNGGDVVSAEGYKNYNTLAGIAKLYSHYRRDPEFKKRQKVPNQETLHILKTHPDMVESADYVCGSGQQRMRALLDKTVIGFFHWLFSQKHPEEAKEFWSKFKTGADLSEDSPILLLRNRLLANKATKIHKLTQRVKMAFVVKAWNAFLTGGTYKILRFTESRIDKERFPTVL